VKQLIIDYLSSQKKKRVQTKDIEDYLMLKMGSSSYWKKGGYQQFAKAIETLVTEELIRPIKIWNKNGLNPPLYSGYQIISQGAKPLNEVKKRLLTQYHPSINTSVYIKNPEQYQQDEIYLNLLDKFLRQHDMAATWLTVNERSFQIFHDEKWLASNNGHAFLQRLGLSYQDLNCYPTYEPFFYYQVNALKLAKINILIVENKDTFFSLKMLFQQGINSWAATVFAMLIYGEGKKIIKSFSFLWELKEYQDKELQVYYFGDLDREGIAIWHELQRRTEVDIKPFVYFYQELLERYRALEMPKQQRMVAKAVEDFLAYFSTGHSKLIFNIMANGRYLPQEGLNYQVLCQLADVKKVE
jgi:hypothetical protein